MEKTLTIIIPAYNEAGGITATVNEVVEAIGDSFADYEVLVINDGSVDDTARIIEDLAKANPHVKAIHNEHNIGFGATYARGVQLATMNYVGLIPGDNEISGRSIKDFFQLVGSADIVSPFTVNMEVRPYVRRIVSRLYTLILNTIFVCELQYYNGPTIYRRDILQATPVNTSGFAFMSSTLVRLIRSGHSFIEAPMYLRPRKGGTSSAFRLKNIISVCWTIAKLVKTIYFDEKERYGKPNRRILYPGVPAEDVY